MSVVLPVTTYEEAAAYAALPFANRRTTHLRMVGWWKYIKTLKLKIIDIIWVETNS